MEARRTGEHITVLCLSVAWRTKLGILGIGESGSERSLEFGSLFSIGAPALCSSATHTTAAATPHLKMSRHGDILKGQVDPHRVSGSLTQATYGIVHDCPVCVDLEVKNKIERTDLF